MSNGIAFLITCHNRKEKTVECIKKIGKVNEKIQVVIVDDGSTDGTREAISRYRDSIIEPNYKVILLEGNGNLYYSGGMHKAMEYARKFVEADYYILMNDDVDLFDGTIEKIMHLSREKVYLGAFLNRKGECTYGGVRYTDGIHYERVTPYSEDLSCDTFNANFVVIPSKIFRTVPIMDSFYKHSLGDFDYGLSIKRAGYKIEVLPEYAGYCENNTTKGTWLDTSLSRRQRFEKKEDVKGAPFRYWFYFLKKNFGLLYAIVYSITPYLRIMIGK